jgi:hypothetical protein
MLNLQSIYFGQKHPNFDYKDFEVIKKVQRLARKHLNQAVNDCNGVGWVNGQNYFNGQIDDWARRQYGQGVKSAYIDNTEETIFYREMEKIEEKIDSLILLHNRNTNQKDLEPFKVEYQGDPRENTVKLYYEGEFIDL